MVRQPSVPRVVSAFAEELRELLGDDLIGVYLGGSFVMGDFDPKSSDYDLLVVLRHALTPGRVRALRRSHQAFAREHADAARLEGDYVPRSWLRATGTTRPAHFFRHGRIQRPAFMLSADNVANMREQGITVVGPSPRRVLPRVSRDEVRAAAREMLHARAAYRTPEETAEAVIDALRSMRAIETGRPTTKSEAVRWGLERLDAKWHRLIHAADAVRRGRRADGAALGRASALVRSLRATDRASGSRHAS